MARSPKPGFIVGDSIADILAEAGISIGRARLVAGGNAKLTCPACQGGRTREQSLSVKLDADGQGAAWHCKRGTCGGSAFIPGNGRIETAADGQGGGRQWRDHGPAVPAERVVVKPKVSPLEMQDRPPQLLGLFRRRGISEETVAEFSIYATRRRWPQLQPDGVPVRDAEGELVWHEKATMVLPYFVDGEVVNRKLRSPQKQFAQDKDSLRSLFNIDAWVGDDVGILVEGEMDVLALWEAGYRQVASLPDGTSNKLLEEDDPKRETDHRFLPLQTHAEKLAKMKRFILATDSDVPGQYLAEEFARRLGRVRCWKATWPEGSKDANDVLLRHMPAADRGQREPTEMELELGRADLRRAVENAQPWPLEGLVTIQPGQLGHFLRQGRQPKGWESGIGAMDSIAQMPAGGGWLTVVTGLPGHGKTTAMRPWLTWLAQRHNLGIVWCSPEDNQAETVALEVARVIIGQPLYEAGTIVPEHMLERAERWIGKHITFLQSNNPDTEMTLEWVLERAEQAKKRFPRHLLVLDPWNEFEHQLGRNETETQYTGRWLRRLKAWGRAEGMGIVIVAHPKNQVRDPKTKKYPVVDGYDINGGANWNNKADLGLTVYRGEEGLVEMHNWKARFGAFGKRHGKAVLELNKRSGRLRSVGELLDDTGADQGESTHGA